MPRFETKDGCELYYRDQGNGSPVVLLHGWGLGGAMWEYQVTSLVRDGMRCIALDARGCGRSDDIGRGYDYDTLADDVAELLECCHVHDATLVVHSMSAGTAARYLARHGSPRVSRVVMLAPTRPCVIRTESNPEGMDMAFFDFTREQLAADRPAFLHVGAAGFFGDCPVSDAIIDWTLGLILSASPFATIEYVRTMSETDWRDDLARIDVPVLVLHGDKDASTPYDLAGRAIAEATGGRFVLYEGAGHGLFYTHRERLNADIASFVRGESSAATRAA
jgi:non-heme chloroperoxidase